MERNELVQSVRQTLISAGFYVSDLYSIRLPGFDLVGRRDNDLLIIKVLTNIDAFSDDVATELKTLSSLLNATPLLIGEKTGLNPLEDDVVYFRFGVYAVTLNTMRDNLLEGIPIRAFAAPGGFYVHLDQEKLQKLRHRQGISLGTFARHVRVSRKTAQLYEKGMNAQVDVAARIEDLLDDTITVPIDLMSPPFEGKVPASRAQAQDRLKDFQREIFSLLENVGYKIIPMDRCPFEAVSKEKKQVILTCVHKYNKNLSTKASIVSGISKITEKHAVLVTDKDTDKTNIGGTPLIRKRELKRFRGPEEVIELIIERIIESED